MEMVLSQLPRLRWIDGTIVATRFRTVLVHCTLVNRQRLNASCTFTVFPFVYSGCSRTVTSTFEGTQHRQNVAYP